MRKRQIISALTAAVMAMGTLPALAMTAAADSTTENAGESAETAAMRTALTDVKKRVKIPEKYDKFDYKTETEYETTYYRFIWYTGELKWNGEAPYDEGIVVEYYNGFISSYELYEDEDRSSKPSFSKLTPEQQAAYAKKYFYMLNPDIKGNVIIKRGGKEKDLFSKAVTFYVDRKEGGVDMPGNGGKIVVDRDTGALKYFKLEWWSDAVIPEASERLSVSEVSDIYASRKPLEAYYDLYYKYEDDGEGANVRVPCVLAVYRPTVSGENEIDAITGKYTEAAQIPGIYVPPFKNISADDPYCGFIAIAKAKGLISGKDGEFNVNGHISRGQCLKLFYDYIAGDKDMKVYQITRI